MALKSPALACLVISAFMLLSASAAEDAFPWRQQELTEPFMRGLSKGQCMQKTIATLQTDCSDQHCLKTIAAITGDCVTWATGNLVDFCRDYDRDYLTRYCYSNILDGRRCSVLHIGKDTMCKPLRLQ